MLTRRMFVTALAGTAAALSAGVRMPAASAAAGIDPGAVATLDGARRPTQWGMSLPGIVTSFNPSGRQLALTLDACDHACDDALLDTLERNGVPATLFVCSKWIDANPGRTEQLAANPLFDIGNHGTRHVPLSVTGRSAYGIAGTTSAAEAVDEVWTEQARLSSLIGRAPTFFRTGTAHYDDVAVQIVHDLGLTPVGFSVNADNGATAPAAAVGAAISRAAPGSIVLAHMNHPRSGTGPGVAMALPAMLAAGWQFVPLAGQALQ
ncbi:polysaccharide deacetylase family protein [Mycolicibacterium sp.]|uniref:polysaccharide deacetylase family protein n=1 Tax=Mycolicibacterium sp. TaxID=2320850 RepID=UPI001A292941|nr:polysaccharide deacetylase family protein [Mycolicibacterium sp.]MBJ7341450.1 polysaccharide deacetylase family protein [Mycolicibacterium sp.]